MKRFLPSVLSTLAVALLVSTISLPLVGCSVGQTARDEIGTPALALADNGVFEDIERGIAALEAADTDDSFNDASAMSTFESFRVAIESGDRWRMSTEALPVWPIVSDYASQGFDLEVASGELSPASAVLLQRRLAEFGVVLAQVSQGAELDSD